MKVLIVEDDQTSRTVLKKYLEPLGSCDVAQLDNRVAKMYVSIDFGTTWQTAKLKKPVNRLAWQHWTADVRFPEQGYYEVWARAVDDDGKSQPVVLPGWNPRGYLNNACHRIAVKVTV